MSPAARFLPTDPRSPFRIPSLLTAVALVLVPAAASLAAADVNWPQFRGLHADGVAEGFQTPSEWNVETGKNVRWRAAIAGLAHSCPIVWDDRIYVTTAITPGQAELKVGLYGDIEPLEEKESVQWHLLALDKRTGKVLW